MREVTIDFSSCSNWLDVHKTLQERLHFPDHYGTNLDALWDFLTGYMETPIVINVCLSNIKKGALDEAARVVMLLKELAEYDSEVSVNYL